MNVDSPLGKSKALFTLVVTAFSLGMVIPWQLPIVYGAKCVLSFMGLAGLILTLRDQIYHAALNSVVALRLATGGECAYQLRNGKWGEGEISSGTIITPYLALLVVKSAQRSKYVLIFADALRADEFRKLSVLLKWDGPSRLAPKSDTRRV